MISKGENWIFNSFRIIPSLFKNLFNLYQDGSKHSVMCQKHRNLLGELIENNFYPSMEIIMPITNDLIASNSDNISTLIEILNEINTQQLYGDNEFYYEWFNLFEYYQLFETIFKLTAKSYSQITTNFALGFIDLLIENYPIQVKEMSAKFIKELNSIDYRNTNVLISILRVDNQMNGELMVDRNKIMVLVSEHLKKFKRLPQIDFIFHLFSKELSTNDETCISVLNQILELININLLSGELKIITHIFNCLQLDAFPCFQKSFQLCLETLGEFFSTDLNHHQMEDLLDLIYKLIRIFGKEVEPFISNTNFLEMINQLSKVNLIHFQQRLILHLLFLTIF
jgi:hypothetical protein